MVGRSYVLFFSAWNVLAAFLGNVGCHNTAYLAREFRYCQKEPLSLDRKLTSPGALSKVFVPKLQKKTFKSAANVN